MSTRSFRRIAARRLRLRAEFHELEGQPALAAEARECASILARLSCSYTPPLRVDRALYQRRKRRRRRASA